MTIMKTLTDVHSFHMHCPAVKAIKQVCCYYDVISKCHTGIISCLIVWTVESYRVS